MVTMCSMDIPVILTRAIVLQASKLNLWRWLFPGGNTAHHQPHGMQLLNFTLLLLFLCPVLGLFLSLAAVADVLLLL